MERRAPSLHTEVRTVRMVRSSITEVIPRLAGPPSASNRDRSVWKFARLDFGKTDRISVPTSEARPMPSNSSARALP